MLWKRAVLFGFGSWLIPFAVSFLTFPIKRVNAPLLSTLMGLVLLITGGLLLRRYFLGRPVSLKEAMLAGTLWLAMNLVLDYPMFAYGPLKMTAAAYYSEIGLSYLALPAFAFGAARMAQR